MREIPTRETIRNKVKENLNKIEAVSKTDNKVFETTDYEQFNFLPQNRQIDTTHVKKLIFSIKTKNLLHFKPIIVDSEFNVLDGQHRLQAAKHLEVPIFYQVNNAMNDVDIITIQNQKNWNNSDYFNYFVAKQEPEYMKMLAFMEDNKISLKRAIIYAKSTKYRIWEDFRAGKMEFLDNPQDEFDIIKKIIDAIRKITVEVDSGKSWLNAQMVSNSIKSLMEHPDFVLEVFMKKIPYCIHKIHPCGRYKDYYKMFTDVYNYKNPNPLSP